MEWLAKIVDWFLRETWWRRYYKRVTLDEKTTWSGRCLVCDAGTPNNKSIRCDIMHDRDCPCKYNQCLKFCEKIKIVSRIEIEGCEETETIYDVYYGFTGLPTTFPFCTKWKIDKAGLTKDELLEWFKTSCLGYRNITIKL